MLTRSKSDKLPTVRTSKTIDNYKCSVKLGNEIITGNSIAIVITSLDHDAVACLRFKIEFLAIPHRHLTGGEINSKLVHSFHILL